MCACYYDLDVHICVNKTRLVKFDKTRQTSCVNQIQDKVLIKYNLVYSPMEKQSARSKRDPVHNTWVTAKAKNKMTEWSIKRS